MSYVISSSGKHDMDTLSSKFLDHKPISYESVAGKGKDQISFADVEISKAVEYACEDADLTLFADSVDLIFTSPPYFNTEKYSEDDTQSWVRYKKIDDWNEKVSSHYTW